MNQSFEVVPTGHIDEATGEMVYGEPTINGKVTPEMRRTEEFDHERRFVEDDNGEVVYNHNTASEQDIAHIMSGYGDETYQEGAKAWATKNYDQDDVDGFNEIMASGDVVAIAEAIDQVAKLYEDRDRTWDDFQGFEDTQSDAEDVGEVEETEPQPDEVSQWVFNSLIDQNSYNSMVEWASNNLDNDTIIAFNELVSSGNKDYAEKAIRELHNKFQANN